MRSGLNTVVFLIIVIISILIFTGFELFHRANDKDIPPKLIQHTNNPLPKSFDTNTLDEIYKSKDKYYEYQQ